MKRLHLTRARAGIFGVLGLALFLSVIIFTSGTSAGNVSVTPTPTPRPTDLGANLVTHHTFPSLSYGVQTFLWWNYATRPRDLEMVRLMRFDTVKQVFDWTDIQPDPKLPYNWAHSDAVVQEVQYRQLRLIARIGLPPQWVRLAPSDNPDEPPFDLKALGQYCHDLADRYKGKIAGYEVWNEPNLAREWGGLAPSPAGYVKLLKTCYQAIKKADPAAVVISAGLSPTGNNDVEAMLDESFLVEMYQAGAAPYFDVLGLHAPGYKSPPDLPPDDPSLDGGRWASFRHVEDMRAIMVAQGDGAKQVALLEVGWTTDQRDMINGPDGKPMKNPYRWHAVTEDQQAQYLVGAYQYAAEHWRPWVGLMITIYMEDPDWTPDKEEYWWGVTYGGFNLIARPAYFALSRMAQYTDDKIIPAAQLADFHTPLPPPAQTSP